MQERINKSNNEEAINKKKGRGSNNQESKKE